MTDSMKTAINETARRREAAGRLQRGARHHPDRDRQAIDDVLMSVYERDYLRCPRRRSGGQAFRTQAELDAHIAALEKEMKAAAANLDFEKAATLRDRDSAS